METAQDRRSVKSLLEIPALYELFSRVVGAQASRETFVGTSTSVAARRTSWITFPG
jgi:hypothetical protein